MAVRMNVKRAKLSKKYVAQRQTKDRTKLSYLFNNWSLLPVSKVSETYHIINFIILFTNVIGTCDKYTDYVVSKSVCLYKLMLVQAYAC